MENRGAGSPEADATGSVSDEQRLPLDIPEGPEIEVGWRDLPKLGEQVVMQLLRGVRLEKVALPSPHEALHMAANAGEGPIDPHTALVIALARMRHVFGVSDALHRVSVLEAGWSFWATNNIGMTDIAAIDTLKALGWVKSDVPTNKGPRDPSSYRQQRRLAALGTLIGVFRDLDLIVGDPTAGLRLFLDSPFTRATTRPLESEEVVLCMEWSFDTLDDTTRLPAIVAWGKVGGATSEGADLRCSHVDVDNRTIVLSGGAKYRPRVMKLDSWDAQVFAKRIEHVRKESKVSDPYVLVNTESGTIDSRRNSISTAFDDVYTRAGLADDQQVKPESIRLWAGMEVWNHTNDIIAVANALGINSLDKVANDLRILWKQEREQTP